MRLMLTIHDSLLSQLDTYKPINQSRAEYIREAIRQRLQRERTTKLKE